MTTEWPSHPEIVAPVVLAGDGGVDDYRGLTCQDDAAVMDEKARSVLMNFAW